MLLAASLLSYIMWRLILKLSADGISPSTNIHWLHIAYRIKCKPFCWLIVHHDWALIDLSLLFFFCLNSLLPCFHHSSQHERPGVGDCSPNGPSKLFHFLHTPASFSHWCLFCGEGHPPCTSTCLFVISRFSRV